MPRGSDALISKYDLLAIPVIDGHGRVLCALFPSEMLTASATQGFEEELEKTIVLMLFIPLIIRALALYEVTLRDVALRELPTGLTLGAILGAIGPTSASAPFVAT